MVEIYEFSKNSKLGSLKPYQTLLIVKMPTKLGKNDKIPRALNINGPP
jgi:hypothetical protein